MKIRSIFFYSLLIVFCWTLLGALKSCSKPHSESQNIFYYNESNGISNLDPAFSRDLEIMWVTNQLFDGLVELDSTLQVIPSIASHWQISEDGKTYTFFLRDSVFFHPSPLFADSIHRKVTAQDFVYSFKRLLDPKLASPARWIFSQVNTEYNGGFEAVNDTTLAIYLKQSFQPFLGMLSMQYCSVIPHEVAEYYGQDFRSHPIGTGPFKLAYWYEQVALVLHKHQHYMQKDSQGHRLPYLDAVKIDFVKDMSVEFQGLLQGRYDFMSGIHPAFKDELLDMDGNLSSVYDSLIYFQKTPFIKTDYLGFMVDPAAEINKNSPLMDVKVRQAISYGIDKKKMVKYLRNNTVFAASQGFVPPVLLRSESPREYYTYNRAKALELLEQAGYPNGKGLPPIVVSTVSDYTDLIEFIQHELSKIGIEVKVNVLQGPALREQSAKAQLAIFRKSWLADYADAENFLAVFYSPNFCPAGPNYTHYKNTTFDQLYLQTIQEKDEHNRINLYSKMDGILMSDAPVIPLYYDQVSHFIRREITGLQTNPVNMLDLRRVRKTTKARQL